MVHLYRAAGLTIESDVRLPGFRPAESGSAVEVTIRRGSVPLALACADQTGPTWQSNADNVLLRIPHLARFLIRDGRHIAFEPEQNGDENALPAFLGGSIFGLLLHQRREIVLHASAVMVGGKAVLFSGRSGAGKSTFAALFASQGFPLIADDQGALSIDADGRPVIQSDGRMLKLWERSIEALGLTDQRGEPVRHRLGKYYVAPPQDRCEPIPIGPIYLINEARHLGAPEIERLNVVDATKTFVANAYRPLMVRRMNQRPAYLQMAAAISASGGVFRLRRRVAFDAIEETVAALRAHWAEIGLAPQP